MPIRRCVTPVFRFRGKCIWQRLRENAADFFGGGHSFLPHKLWNFSFDGLGSRNLLFTMWTHLSLQNALRKIRSLRPGGGVATQKPCKVFQPGSIPGRASKFPKPLRDVARARLGAWI